MSRTEMGVIPGPVRQNGTAADGTATGAATALTVAALQSRRPGKYLLSLVADDANTGKVYVCLAPREPGMPAAEVKAVASVILSAGGNLTIEVVAGGADLPLAHLAGSVSGQLYRAEIWAVALE